MSLRLAVLYGPLAVILLGGALTLAAELGQAVGLRAYAVHVFLLPSLVAWSALFFLPLYYVQRDHAVGRPHRFRDMLSSGYYGAARLTNRGKLNTYAFVALYLGAMPLLFLQAIAGMTPGEVYEQLREVVWIWGAIFAGHIAFALIQVIRFSRRARHDSSLPEARLRRPSPDDPADADRQ